MVHAIDIRVRGEDLGDPPTSVQIPRGVARGRAMPRVAPGARTRSHPRPRPCGSRPYGRPRARKQVCLPVVLPSSDGHYARSVGVAQPPNPASRGPRCTISSTAISSPAPLSSHASLHHPLLRSVPHHARRRRAHMLVVPQHRTGQDSLVGNDTIMSWTVIELSPRWTGTDITPVTGTIVADDDRTVGHTPGSTTPSRRVPGARSASAMTG